MSRTTRGLLRVLTIALAMALAAGAADAAIVYRTDIRISLKATVAWTVPAAAGPRIVYPGAIIKTTAAADEAQRFLDFLRGDTAVRIFERFGFTRAERPPG